MYIVRNRHSDEENKPVVTSGEKEGRRVLGLRDTNYCA